MEGKVWPSQQLQSLQFPLMPASVFPTTSPAGSAMALAKTTFSTMVAPYGFHPDWSVPTVAMPSGFAATTTSPVMALGCASVANQAVVVQQSVKSGPLSTRDAQTLFVTPPSMVGQTMVVQASMTNQSLILPSGVPNQTLVVHSGMENPVMSFCNPPELFGSNPVVETSITLTQKVMIPNSNMANILMPSVAMPSSPCPVAKPVSFVTSIVPASTNDIMMSEFTDCLQPKIEVKMEPSFTASMGALKSASQVSFSQQTSHSAFSHVVSSLPLPNVIFPHDTFSSQISALNVDTPQQLAPSRAFPTSCDNASNNIMQCLGSAKHLAANIGIFQETKSNEDYSFQQILYNMDSSQQQVIIDGESQRIMCSKDSYSSQQFTPGTYSQSGMLTTISSDQSALDALSSHLVTPDADSSLLAPTDAISSQLAPPDAVPSQLAAPDAVSSQLIAPNAVSPQLAASNADSSQLAPPDAVYSQLAVPNTVSPQLAVLDTASQLAVPSAISSQMTATDVASSQVAAPDVVSSQVAAPDVVSSQITAPDAFPSQLAASNAVYSQLAVPDAASSHLAVPNAISSQLTVTDASSSQLAVPDINASQLVVADVTSQLAAPNAASSLVTPDATSSQVTHDAVSSQLVTLNGVQENTLDMLSSHGVAHFMDVSSSSSMFPGPPVEVSAASPQVVSTMTYSEHLAFSTHSFQKLTLKEEPLQHFIETETLMKSTDLERVTPEVLTCDVEIKTEPPDTLIETSSCNLSVQHTADVDNSEVKLESKQEAIETVSCDAYMALSSVSSQLESADVQSDPLGKFSTSEISLPVPPSPCSPEIVEGQAQSVVPNGYGSQIVLILPPIDLSGKFHDFGNSRSLPAGHAAVSPLVPVGGGTPRTVPGPPTSTAPDPSCAQFQASEAVSKLPIPKLQVCRQSPRMKKPVHVVKKASKSNIPKKCPKKILPRPNNVAKVIESFSGAGCIGLVVPPEAAQTNSQSGCPQTQLVVGASQKPYGDVPRMWVYVKDARPQLQQGGHLITQNPVTGGIVQVVSGCKPVGISAQGPSEAGLLDGTATISQNNLSQSSSYDGSGQADTEIQKTKLPRNRPPPSTGVLSNDQKDLMLVICASCLAEETDIVTTGYPDHEKAYNCDRCHKPCYQYFFKYRDLQAPPRRDWPGIVQGLARPSDSKAGLSRIKRKRFCRGKSKNYVCDICGMSYKSNMGFYYHYAKHTNVFRYRCDECGKGFHYRRNFNQHKSCHVADRKFQCHLCFKKFKSDVTLKEHVKRHNFTGAFPCEWCDLVYTHARSYRYHKKTVHKVVTGTQCQTCLGHFENLNHHVCTPAYECDVCGKRFSKRRNFQTHFAVHSGAGSCRCEVCHKVYPGLGKLNDHMRSHSSSWSERYPYLCEVCGRGFSLRGTWKVHRKVHVRGKKYRLKFFQPNFVPDACTPPDKSSRRRPKL